MPRRTDDAPRPSQRAAVLKAAMEVMAEKGPEKTRVQDIAARAGMSAGHVLYYFGKRDRILVDTLLESEADAGTQRDRRIAAAPSPLDAVERLVRLYLPSGSSDLRWKLWAQLVARPPQDAETLAAYDGVLDGWTTALADAIGAGVDDGTFTCRDPQTTAYRACRLMDGYALEVLLGAPGRTRAWAVSSVLEALDDELATRP